MNGLELRRRIDELASTESFTHADEKFHDRLTSLVNDAREMMINNPETIYATVGTNYYVSNLGDDNNDGMSPETAWATLDKVNNAPLNEGDCVLFNRGDFFRGRIITHSGVTYSAYGDGKQPIIANSIDGKSFAKWVKTDNPNIWKLDMPIKTQDPKEDIGVILFNMSDLYAEKKMRLDNLQNDLDFCHYNLNVGGEFDDCVYLYSDKGNPSDRFEKIDLSLKSGIAQITAEMHDITLHNLAFWFSGDLFCGKATRNITVKYCSLYWVGGYYGAGGSNVRMGGGAGCWHSCENMIFKYCYFYQQFDSGVTPQFNHRAPYFEDKPAIFNGFYATDCLFEKCEYSFEPFNSQSNLDANCFKNVIFNYNICIDGGRGFGDKHDKSAYVKSWNHENTFVGCEIAHNIFDRAEALCFEIMSHDFGNHANRENMSYDHLPKLFNNLYIEHENKSWANINLIFYNFNKPTKIALERLGVDKDSTYVYSE